LPVNGDSHQIDRVELAKAGVKLERAPIPIADTTADPVCYCPECGARLRAIVGAAIQPPDNSAPQPINDSAATKASRSTLVDWVPGAKAAPNSPVTVDDDEEPTRVGRSPIESPLAATSDAAPSASTLKPAAPIRQKMASEDDEHTVRLRRVEDLKLRPTPSVVHREPLPNPFSKFEPPEPLPNPFSKFEPPDTMQVDAKEVVASPPLAPFASPPLAPVVALAAPAHADASTIPAVELRDTNRGVLSVQPTVVERHDSEFEYQIAPRKRRGAAVFPILGLGLGIAVAGGLGFLVYGNTTSIGRARPSAALAVGDGHSPNGLATEILSAKAVASAVASEAPAATAAAEPSVTDDVKRDAKAIESTATTRKTAEAPKVRATTRAAAAANTTSGDTEVEAAKGESPAPEAKRKVATAATKAENVKATDEDGADGPKFDSDAAAGALESAAQRASTCRQPTDPSGVARVTVTFAPSGRVTTANLAGPPFVGTPTGSCIATVMRSATIPSFSGNTVTVHKTVTIM